MKKFLKKFIDILAFCLGVRGTETARKYVDLGILDFSGQGRDKYGR